MAVFKEIIRKNFKVQIEITLTIEKYNTESYSTETKPGQKTLLQSKVFEQAITFTRETIEDMDIKREQKDNKIELLENKIGFPDCKVIEETNSLRLNKSSSIGKGDRVMDRLSI